MGRDGRRAASERRRGAARDDDRGGDDAPRRRKLHGFRLAPGAKVYTAIVSQEQRLRCERLGLDLALEHDRIRFYVGNAMHLEMPEVVARLQQMTDEVTARAEQEAQRAEQEAQRADQLAARIAELEAELERRR